MVTVEELAKHTSAECPRILSAVLKALRGEDETAATIEQLQAHVAGCPACSKRLPRLGRLIQALTGEPAERGPARGEGSEPALPDQAPASRRQHRRLPTNEAVNLIFEDGSVALARMIEVSAKGAKIESHDELQVGQNLTLNRGRRSTQVAVRHCSRQGELFIVGVEHLRQTVSA